MSDKAEEFLNDYWNFKVYAEESSITNGEPEIIQLFDIYRKDARASMITKNRGKFFKPYSPAKKVTNPDLPATDRQIAFLKDLMEKQGIAFDQEKLNGMTVDEASKSIDKYKGVGG